MNKNRLDFIIVGIQKSGTTMLHSYLSKSKKIFIPPEKELPFFLEKKIYAAGWDAFIQKYFGKAENNQIWGTVTPQYMMYPESLKKIYNKLPDIKIIIIYRDPIKRFISHYDMLRRFNIENRDINDLIIDQLANIKTLRNTEYNRPTDKFISSGEYLRLNKHLEIFPKKNILKLDFNVLVVEPKIILEEVSNFLNIDYEFKQDFTIKMEGGSKKIIDVDFDNILRKIKHFLVFLQIYKYIPQKIIKYFYLISYWIDQVNVNKKSKSSIRDINKDVQFMLQEHYKEEILEYRNMFKNDN